MHDLDAFRRTLSGGLGVLRAFGHGLLQIAPWPPRDLQFFNIVQDARRGYHAQGQLEIEEARIPEEPKRARLVERCRMTIDNGSMVIAFDEADEQLELPYQRLNALLLGPGSTITHDAVRHLSGHRTCIAFVGTDGARIYTAPPIFEHDATLARKQAIYWASPTTRVMVAKRMYQQRFGRRRGPTIRTACAAWRRREKARLRGDRATGRHRLEGASLRAPGPRCHGPPQPGDQPRRDRPRGRSHDRRSRYRNSPTAWLPA